MLQKVFHLVVSRSCSLELVECCVEWLSVGKAHHVGYVAHVEADVSLVGEKRHGIVDAVGVDKRGEVQLYGMHISPYEKGNIFNKDPLRVRKLLLHKYEIRKLIGKMDQKGYTLVPLSVYFKGSKIKVEIALAKGKKLYDKRQDIAKKDQRRAAEREFKVKNL